jgi:hypothetical protein
MTKIPRAHADGWNIQIGLVNYDAKVTENSVFGGVARSRIALERADYSTRLIVALIPPQDFDASRGNPFP